MDTSTFGNLEEACCEAGEEKSRCSGTCSAVRIGEMECGCGRRHDEELEPIEWKELHVGGERSINCGHMQAVLTNILQRRWRVAGRPARCLGSGVLHVSDCVCGQLGRKNSVRCGRAFRGVKDTDIRGDPRTRCGGTSGGDEGRERVSLRAVRRSSAVQGVYD